VRAVRRLAAAVFAGDQRVWQAALAVAVPLVALIAFYCLRPRPYYTGTNSVETLTYIAETPAGQHVCVPNAQIPAGTGRIRLQLISATTMRPALHMTLTTPASGATTAASGATTAASGAPADGQTLNSELPATEVPADRISAAEFPIPKSAGTPSGDLSSLCVSASGLVNWGGTPLPAPPSPSPPTQNGHAIPGRISLWYLPPAGSERSYASQAGEILSRASLFRPGLVGPWLYVLILLVVLPGLALASVRCLAIAARRQGFTQRRMAASLFAIAAVNFACWALITPPFQAPDEVDHFAYTQSLVERSEAPSRNPGSPLPRWSSAEALALEDISFFSDHQVGDSRAPWSASQEAYYRGQVAKEHPTAANGGGNETAATHGAIYYAALAPAYMLASSSPFDQLTLMRLTSALIGALTALFAFLLARELAPGRPWLAVLAALLVVYEPMYGFISGAVNNDVGVNAGAAGLELLLILLVRRGFTLTLGLLTGGLLIALPIVKATGESLYPVAAIAFAATLWRHHRRVDLKGLAGLALAALAVRELSSHLAGVFRSSSAGSSGGASGSGLASGTASNVLAHPLGYLGYLWEVFLPRLSFMAPHFETATPPAFVIFVERGWGAFGWYDVFFPHWMYKVILAAMLLVPLLGLLALRREWRFVRRNLLESAVLALMPIAVVAGFEAAYYTTGSRPAIAEFGRYAFPAIAPLAVLVVASLHAFPRRWALLGGTGLLVSMLSLSYAAQLVTLTGFYA
jgi:Predicted membrane protein (DUF2142)